MPHQCPTCLCYFSRNDIEEHAEICAENWVDRIGDVEPNESAYISDNDEVIDLPDEMCDFYYQSEEASKK